MTSFEWGHPTAPLFVQHLKSAPVRLGISPLPDVCDPHDPTHAMVEILTLEYGRDLTNTRVNRSFVGAHLRYHSHDASENRLVITQSSDLGIIATTTIYKTSQGRPAYSASTTVRNDGTKPIHLQAVSTIVIDGLTGFLGDASELDLWSARNEWDGENRWYRQGVEDQVGIPDINPPAHGQAARGQIHRTNTSTWSTGEHLPVAALENTKSGKTLLWQIESNGPWRWEINSQYDRNNWVSLALLGPTDLQHAWLKPLEPQEEFTTVTASFAISTKSLDDAFATITEHRRNTRATVSNPERPLIFNDYMNTLMGDPTTEKLLPLIDAAAEMGAKYFCIDAGWYDDGGNWWPSVGEWKPSKKRFAPDGLEAVLHRIRERGMKPGLWLEPEVVGVLSPIAKELPDDAFMTRNGVRIREHDRYFLDLRSRAAQNYLDSVFDRVLGDYGAEYIKWDYNVTPGIGPDSDATSPGEALLDHLRAYLSWFEDLRKRYPHVVFEACSSGAQRQDPLTTGYHDLQSTSDQQDYRKYAPISAAAPSIITPEQAGNWAYPNPNMDPEQTAFAMINGLAGRVYLSGYLNHMGAEQLAVIKEATDLYPEIIEHNSKALPHWPLGLPQWDDQIVLLALSTEESTLLYVWKRGESDSSTRVDLSEWAGENATVEFLYPAAQTSWSASWDNDLATLILDHEEAGESARVIRVTWKK